MRSRHWMVASVLVIVMAAPAVGQEVKFGGQVRPRFEFRDPSGSGDDSFTSMRVRAQLSATLERNVGVFIQVQDVRLWGDGPVLAFPGLMWHTTTFGYAGFGCSALLLLGSRVSTSRSRWH